MKTTQLNKLYQSLSDLNNSFTHYSLVWSQFYLDYEEIFKKQPEKLTKDYFTKNPFKRTHNIKFNLIDAEHKKTNDTLLKGIFLLIYTYFEEYLKDLINFAKDIDTAIPDIDDKIDIEDDYILLDKVLNRIGIEKSNFDSELMLTLDYFRIKRNRLIHSNSKKISNVLNKNISNNGKSLNKYWNRPEIDFNSKKSANDLSFEIIISMIIIFRDISAKIDKLTIDKLGREKIFVNSIIPNFKIEIYDKNKNLKFDRILKKFVGYTKSKYGIDIDDRIIELFKSSIA